MTMTLTGVGTAKRYRHAPLQKLIHKVAHLTRPQKKRSLPRERYAQSSSSEYDLSCLTANMAEQEEDFSSLPIQDRFTHKVRCGSRPWQIDIC